MQQQAGQDLSFHASLIWISDTLEAEEVLDRLLAAVTNHVPCSGAAIYLKREAHLELAGSTSWNDQSKKGIGKAAIPERPTRTLLNQAVEANSVICVGDIGADTKWVSNEDAVQVGSWMAVPFQQGEIQGAVAVENGRPNSFGEGDQETLSTLAACAASALVNAKRYSAKREELSELDTLYQASASMSANLDQDFVLRTVVAEMVRVLQVDSCAIYVWDENMSIRS
jgi:GAF domain-containing protein